jgi:hypothetical protein
MSTRPKRWFMSYVKTLTRVADVPSFGSAVVDDGEHPIAKVQRWNDEMDWASIALLFFCEIPQDPAIPELTVET